LRIKKPAIFLGLTFLLSWPVAFLVFGGGMNLYTAGGLVVAVYFMFTPSISAVITQKLIYRQNLMSLRLSFRPNGWFLVALLPPATIANGPSAGSRGERRSAQPPLVAPSMTARDLQEFRQPDRFFASLFEFFPCSPSRIILQLWGNEFNFTTEHKWVRISHQWPPA